MRRTRITALLSASLLAAAPLVATADVPGGLPPSPDAGMPQETPERGLRVPDGCYILISRSLGMSLLRKIFAEAADAGCTAVFRGIGKGGIQELVNLIAASGTVPDSMIDPELFQKSSAAGVPSGVRVKDGRVAAVAEGTYSAELLRNTEGFRKYGPVSAVSEPDLLLEIRKRAAMLNPSMERRKAVRRFLEGIPSWTLPTADLSTVTARVPRIRAPESLKDSDFPFLRELAGKEIDLLPEGGKEDALLAFSCAAPRSAMRILEDARKRFPDITAACPDYPKDEKSLEALPPELGTPAFLTRELAEALGVKALPALVRTEGKRLVTETFGKEGNDEGQE